MATIYERLNALETQMTTLLTALQNIRENFAAFRDKIALEKAQDAQLRENAKRKLRRRL